ncbi:MAG TPA: glycosyltransferase family 39 protein [Aldersonia sp.]
MVPPFAWRRVGGIALLVVLALTLSANRYGYHRDELYFLVAGRHPAWGYADQPPLVPLIARLADTVAPGSLLALRTPATAAAVVIVVATALLARRFGGDGTAQLLAAATVAAAAVVLGAGHLLGTTIFDLAIWTVLLLLVARLTAGGDPIWWLAVGAVVGVCLLNKTLVAFLMAALVVGLAVVGPRQVFASRWPYLGAVVALAFWAPNLWWQARHGWPQLTLSRAIAAGSSGTSDTPATFVLLQFGLIGPLLVPVWVAGLWWLWRRPHWRVFPVAYALLFAAFLLTGGKAYYLAGLYPVLLAAGSIAAVGWMRRGTVVLRATLITVAVVVSALAASVLFLPALPERDLAGSSVLAINYDAGETVGWPRFAQQVGAAAVVPDAVVLTANYGEAGAVAHYLPDGPAVYSGHNAFWWWGPPPEDAEVVVAVGFEPERLDDWFAVCEIADRVDNGLGIDNDEQGAPIVVCRDRRADWAQLWPQLQRLG